MNKLIKAIAWFVFVISLLVVVLGAFTFTDSGTKLIIDVVQRMSPNLHITDLQGSVVDDLHIKQLDWKDKQQRVQIKNLNLKNNISNLSKGEINVETLSADSLNLVLPDTADTQDNTALDIALPFNVHIGNLHLKQLIIQQGKNKQEINNIKLSAHTKDNHLIISGFQAQPMVDGEPVQLNLQANTNLKAPYNINSDLILNYEHEKHGKVTGSFKLNGTINDYTLKGKANLISKAYGNGVLGVAAMGSDHNLSIQTLKLDAFQGQAEATGKLAWDDNNKIDWIFDLQANDINTKDILPDYPATLTTRFNTQGSLINDKTKGVINLETLEGDFEGYPLAATGKVQLQNTQATIEKLHATLLGGVLDTTGDITWGDKLAWDLQLATENLKTKALLPDYPAKLSSRFNTQGTLKDKQANGVIDLKKLTGEFQGLPLSAVGKIKLNGNQADIETLHLSALKGTADTVGTVAWGDQLDWDVKLNTKSIHTEKVLPNLPAIITSVLSSKGTYQKGKTNAAIDLQSLNGKLQGYDLAGKGKIQIKDDIITVEKLQASSGSNTLYADGQASEPFNLQWKLNGKKLNQLYKGLSGNLQAKGQLKGTLKKPQGQAKLTGKALYYQDYHLAAIDLDVQQTGDQYQLKSTLKKLQIGDQKIKNLAAILKGSIENHQLDLNLQHSDADVHLKAKGGWKASGTKSGQWQGTLQKLLLDKTIAGNWSLTSPVTITANEKKFISGKLCLKNKSALACSTNNWQAKSGLQAKGTLNNIPLSLLKRWLPDTVKFAGKANADFNIKQGSGKIKLRLPDNTVTVKVAGQKTQQLQYHDTRLDATLNGNNVSSDFSAHIQDRGNIIGQATIKLPHKKSEDSINGKLTIDVPNLSWANEFVPDVHKLAGQLNSQIAISGTLDQPKITGKANLINGSFSLPETGTKIQNITVNVIAQKANQATISGSLQSGKGKLAITGNVSTNQRNNWKAHVQLQGDRLDFMNTYEIQGVVSPKLTIDATEKAVKITGTLAIPETKITLNELPPTAIYESDDVVILGKTQPKSKMNNQTEKKTHSKNVPFKVHPDVNIIIGDKVSFSGFGLKTNLSGKFRLREHQQEFFAEGNVKVVNGVYKAYGQDLKITQGRLVFNGPIDNPGLDIKAVRNLADVEAGIHLTGTIQKPKTQLFSDDPSLSQTDILSYLLTGRKLAEASGDQSSMLLSAITSLGVSGGEGIARNIGTTLGLDSVNINSDNGLASSELELGKRLGPDLYLKYIVGIFDSLQRIAIEYRINKRLSLEAQSGINQGFDLIYKMERD